MYVYNSFKSFYSTSTPSKWQLKSLKLGNLKSLKKSGHMKPHRAWPKMVKKSFFRKIIAKISTLIYKGMDVTFNEDLYVPEMEDLPDFELPGIS